MRNEHLFKRGVACLVMSCLAALAQSAAAQMPDNDDLTAKRARLERAQAQLREDIQQRTQVLYSLSQSQAHDDANFRRQESALISLRSQEGEVQRQLIRTELRVIEAQIKVEVCPDAAPDRRVVQAELKIAEAQRRLLSDRLDSIHRSMDQALDQFRSRTADLDARRAEIDQLQAKAQRIAVELDKMAATKAPAAASTGTVAAH
jgi:chromosome segregation ATPase